MDCQALDQHLASLGQAIASLPPVLVQLIDATVQLRQLVASGREGSLQHAAGGISTNPVDVLRGAFQPRPTHGSWSHMPAGSLQEPQLLLGTPVSTAQHIQLATAVYAAQTAPAIHVAGMPTTHLSRCTSSLMPTQVYAADDDTPFAKQLDTSIDADAEVLQPLSQQQQQLNHPALQQQQAQSQVHPWEMNGQCQLQKQQQQQHEQLPQQHAQANSHSQYPAEPAPASPNSSSISGRDQSSSSSSDGDSRLDRTADAADVQPTSSQDYHQQQETAAAAAAVATAATTNIKMHHHQQQQQEAAQDSAAAAVAGTGVLAAVDGDEATTVTVDVADADGTHTCIFRVPSTSE